MLNRICLADNVGLVNIVRSAQQADLLKAQGAKHLINSSESAFLENLTEALVATGATIAFDAIGGGPMAGQILGCMEAAANRSAKEYSRYGSAVFKQVYIYGNLDTGPTTLTRSYGMLWGVGGWFLTPFLQKIGRDAAQKLRDRVAAEIRTTFASRYTKEISLAQALDLEEIRGYRKASTGAKVLINPNKTA
jgi:NADPH2:quinone reductase